MHAVWRESGLLSRNEKQRSRMFPHKNNMHHHFSSSLVHSLPCSLATMMVVLVDMVELPKEGVVGSRCVPGTGMGAEIGSNAGSMVGILVCAFFNVDKTKSGRVSGWWGRWYELLWYTL